MVKGQSQAVIQPLTLLQGNPTLVQQQSSIQAVGTSRRAHLGEDHKDLTEEADQGSAGQTLGCKHKRVNPMSA